MAAHSPARSAASASKFGELIPMLARHDAMVLLDIVPECEREAEKRARAGESVPWCRKRDESQVKARIPSVSQSVISRSRAALTPPPARSPAPPLPVKHKYRVLAPGGGYSIVASVK